MSVETPKVEETPVAPIATKPVEPVTVPAETATPVVPEAATTEPTTEAAKDTEATPATDTVKETTVEATPATEGTLGYKAPGLLKQFRYVKHHFWFSEEALTQEAVDSYIKSEKADVAHHNAAWAQETGQGVLFFAKRAEDKATPSGLILLSEATAVTKAGFTDFSFKIGSHTHKFEAATSAERDSWVVAIQKIVDESKDLKAEITGRESYKKTIEGYAFSPVIAGSSATPVKSEAPKKSLDANTATAAVAAEPTKADKIDKADASSSSSDEEAKEAKKAKKAEKEAAKKERSQSRKRNSVFGLFAKKDEEKKAEKEHEKEVKKVEQEAAKEEKKAEAEHKKEEAKAEHDTSKAVEAAEVAAVAAAPAAVVAAVEKKEDDKKADKAVEKPEEVTTPTDKKSKRASVFGGFFGKNKVTSPSAEKSEKEAGPEVPAKDETPAVSETAPKLDEPIETKPIDTAAVTAPVDNAETTAVPAVAATEEPKSAEPTSAADSSATPKTEKKGFLAGLIKKVDKKEEPKEETKTNEEAAKQSTPVAATETAAVPTTETPAQETEAAKEERPAREKRRTSLFGSLGTLKRKTDKSPEPSSVAAEENKTETKREKSPMPSKLGGLFRKPSKAVKSENTEEVKTDATAAKPETTADATPATVVPVATETPANATIVDPKGDSEIIGDVVPEQLHTTVHDAVTTKPEEVKASA